MQDPKPSVLQTTIKDVSKLFIECMFQSFLLVYREEVDADLGGRFPFSALSLSPWLRVLLSL